MNSDMIRAKLRWMLPFLALGGGCAAFALRLTQNRTGFEADTGLPIPGNAAALALLVLLAGACVILALMDWLLLPGFRNVPFSTNSQFFLVPVVAGALLLALSGGADLVEGLGTGNLMARLRGVSLVTAPMLRSSGLENQVQILSGLLTLLAAFGLLLCAASRGRPSVLGGGLLIAPVSFVVRLVAVYRMDSVNPVLEDYAVDLLALAFLTLGFYSLSAFAFQSGSLRRFAFYTCAAELFCLCSLADQGPYLSTPLIYAGGALSLLGFLLLALRSVPAEAQETEEEL